MSWLNRIATGLGTLIGVLAETSEQVVSSVRRGYEEFKSRGGATGASAKNERARRNDTLRDINEELAEIRRKAREGQRRDADRRRWDDLREQRSSVLKEQEQAKEVKAAESVLNNAETVDKVVIAADNVHVLTANAFADVVNKRCSACGRKMKLQWRRDIPSPQASDLFWGCTGWYFREGTARRCSHTAPLEANDRALMVDTSLPEFQTNAEDLATILEVPDVQETIIERVDDLASDLRSRGSGVEVATCPVHGEPLVLKKKSGPARGLLDMYHLRCPYWLPNDEGCPFIEKLKSPSQLAILLKSETGSGIL
jgi:Skp family chaperone for outer membrane proteins